MAHARVISGRCARWRRSWSPIATCWRRMSMRSSSAPGAAGTISTRELLNHPLGTDHYGRWQGDAERLRGFQIDDKLERGRLFDRHRRGIRALRNAVDEVADAAEIVEDAGAVAEEGAGFGEFLVANQRDSMLHRSLGQALCVRDKQPGVVNHDRIVPLACNLCEDHIELICATNPKQRNFHLLLPGCFLHEFR